MTKRARCRTPHGPALPLLVGIVIFSLVTFIFHIKLVDEGVAYIEGAVLPQHSLHSFNKKGVVEDPSRETANSMQLPKVLAIYFPQYHRDPLNDKNWGDNFTDWVSLKKSPSINRLGFPIPRPTDLGYYDLTDKEARKHQSELAKEYGVDGFIYHHYFFYDKSHPGPNLEKPLLRMLEDGYPDVPFIFNWAAVKWINVWMGKAIFQKGPTTKINAITLQEQYFDPSDTFIRDHYKWLSRFFHHENYIKVQNQPVFLVYQYNKDGIHILNKLRHFAKEDGFDGLYLIVGRNAAPEHIFVPKNIDDRVTRIMNKRTQTLQSIENLEIFNRSLTYPYPLEWINTTFSIPNWCLSGSKHFEDIDAGGMPAAYNELIGIITTFDNTPRRKFKAANIFNFGSPEEVSNRFYKNLFAALFFKTCCVTDDPTTKDHHNIPKFDFVAVNAWNEWAEGMAMEPSDTYGRLFLEVVQKVKLDVLSSGCSTDNIPVGLWEPSVT